MKIAIISDLHAHSASEPHRSFLVAGQPRRRKLDPVLSLLDLIEAQGVDADIVACPGDLTDACDLQGFAYAETSLRQIANALGASTTLVAAGNHDIDSRDLHKLGPFTPLRNSFQLLPCEPGAGATDFWRDGFYVHNTPTAAIVVLNSAAQHTDLNEAKRGSVAPETLDALETRLAALPPAARVRVVLTHHHPHLHEDLGLGTDDVMRNGSMLLSMLEQHGFQLLVHGHKHHPKLSNAAGGGSSPAVFAAGSFSAIANKVLATNVRNLFHIVDMDIGRLPHCNGCGAIRTWEFNANKGWHPSSQLSAGFPHRAGFGCRLIPSELAAQIAAVVGRRRTEWSSLSASLPHLDYTLPGDLVAARKLLKSVHGLRFRYDEFNDPSEIGP